MAVHPLPKEPTPQLASVAERPPAGNDWLHEIKYDGYRLLCRVEGDSIRLISRNGKDWTSRFGPVVQAVASLELRTALLDGEVAVVGPDGRTRFQDLQNILSGEGRGGALRFFLFDLLHLDGVDWTGRPLIERKQRLASLLADQPPNSVLHYSDHVEGNGPAFYAQAKKFGLEGIVSKRRDSKYVSGRSRDWLKIKCLQTEEFVVGGFTEPGGARLGFGALLLGAYDDEGRLRFVGRAGTGFTDAQLVKLRARLDSIAREESPFVDGPAGRGARDMHWVEPELVAQVAFVDWTYENLLRHPTFRGLREDRPAREVRLPPDLAAAAQRPLTGDAAGGDATPGRTWPPRRRGPAATRKASPADAKSFPPAVTRPAARPAGRTGSVVRVTKTGTRIASTAREVAGIPITNPGKVMYPDAGVRKIDLAEYYEAVAPLMLPRVARRPLTLVRCPEGIGNCFYQKHIEGAIPDAIRLVPVREGGEEAMYAWVESAAGLVALSQLGVLEIHTWGSRQDDLERPDRVTIDLDPDPSVSWIRVVEAVLEVRGLLLELGLESWLKTTGGKGLHVVVPIKPNHPWPMIKGFTRAIAETLAREHPGRYTTSVSKERRRNRILLDYLRNGRGATAIEAWSTRARPGAPVALPLRWEELADGVRSDTFTVQTVPERLARLEADPWEDYPAKGPALTRRMFQRVGFEPE